MPGGDQLEEHTPRTFVVPSSGTPQQMASPNDIDVNILSHISGRFREGVQGGIKDKKAQKKKGAAGPDDGELAARADLLFDAVDNDCSGFVSKDEFRKMHFVLVSEAMGQHSKLARAKKGVIALAAGILVLLSFLGASVALNFVVVDSVVRTGTTNGELTDKETGAVVKVALTKMDVAEATDVPPALVSSDGKTIVGTREEKFALPLVVLPVLPDAELAAVRSLVVTFRRPLYESANAESVNGPRGGVLKSQTVSLSIIRAKRYNDTWATLTAGTGETVEVKNGRASLLEEGEWPAKLCLQKTSCSAIAVSTNSGAEALVESAWAALEERGFGLLLPPQNGTRSGAEDNAEERRMLSLAHFAGRHLGSGLSYRQLGDFGAGLATPGGSSTRRALSLSTESIQNYVYTNTMPCQHNNGNYQLKSSSSVTLDWKLVDEKWGITTATRTMETSSAAEGSDEPSWGTPQEHSTETYLHNSDGLDTYGITLPEFIQCGETSALGTTTCSCKYWPRLTWDYESQAWLEECEQGEDSSVSQKSCADASQDVCKIHAILDSDDSGAVNNFDSGDGDLTGRRLKKKKNKNKDVCAGGKHDCATNKDDYPPCKPLCQL